MLQKKPVFAAIAFLAILASAPSQAQVCEGLLKDGLYSITRMTNTSSFSQDLRTYFLSEQFRQDMKTGKWGGSLAIPIDGVPISLNASHSDEEYSQFRSRLISQTSLRIDASNYQALFSSIPNTNLYDAYVRCIEIDPGATGFIGGTNVETEDFVVFPIYYRPLSPSDPMPTVQMLQVQPPGTTCATTLQAGRMIVAFATSVTCPRHPDKDLILTLQTDRGQYTSKAAAENALGGSRDLPPGTIVASYLSFDQFNAVARNNEKSPGGIWTSAKSKWAPCDGRTVHGSALARIASVTAVPDLRGVFLRGLNSFDPTAPVPPVNPDRSDPEARVAGGFQADALRSHRHGTYGNDSSGVTSGDNPNYLTTGGKSFETANTGGPETRPKNVAIYYYIRIN